ncbi:hypothetical protein FA15DRAFT_697775, partial [Coprinopsis marcescibilis]
MSAAIYSNGPSGQVPPRAIKIRALLYTSIFLSAAVLGVSLVHLGALSLLLAPIFGAFTLIFSITLVILTHKDIKRFRKGRPFKSAAGVVGAPDGTQTVAGNADMMIYASKIASIVFAFLLLVLQIVALGMQIVILVGLSQVSNRTLTVSGPRLGSRSPQGITFGSGSGIRGGSTGSGSGGSSLSVKVPNLERTLIMGGVEAGLIAFQIGILLSIGIVSILERKAVTKLARSGGRYSNIQDGTTAYGDGGHN